MLDKSKKKNNKEYSIKNPALSNLPNVILVPVKLAHLQEYVLVKRESRKVDYSLNDFMQEKYSSKNKNSAKKYFVVISDLSNQTYKNDSDEEILDLKNAIFVGSVFFNTSFVYCNLEGSVFTSTHLDNVKFINSNLNFVDFRFANLSTCEFHNDPSDSSFSQIEGIKLSSTDSCIRIYADIKNEVSKKNEEKRLLDNKNLELQELKKSTPLHVQAIAHLNLGYHSSRYKKVHNELKEMQNGNFSRQAIIHSSFQSVFNKNNSLFEPVMLKDEEYYHNHVKKRYFSLTRNDLIAYLKKIEKQKNLSLNDFAREIYLRYISKENEISKNLKVIADLSSKVNIFGNNEWNRLNLTNLDFSGADLSEVNFSGSNLSGCKFKDVDISNANFESSLIHGAKFTNIDSSDVNFNHADISKSEFHDTVLLRAKFDWSRGNLSKFINVNLDHLTAKNVHWKKFVIQNSSINHSNLQKSDLRKIRVTRLNANHSIFNDCNFTHSDIKDSDFSYSLMCNVNASSSKWVTTICKSVDLSYANFSNTRLLEKTYFSYSDFSHAIFNHTKFSDSCFSEVNFKKSSFNDCNFVNIDLSNAALEFSMLDNSTFNNAYCYFSNFTSANISNSIIKNSNFQQSIFVGSMIKKSSINDVNFKNADWRNCVIYNSVIKNVDINDLNINDNTEFRNNKHKEISGMFSHHDEDDKILPISFEDWIKRLQWIKTTFFVKQIGLLKMILPFMYKKYNLNFSKVLKTHKTRRRNHHELKKHLKRIEVKKLEKQNDKILDSINEFLSRKK